MKFAWQTFVVASMSAALIACGSSAEVESVECGEGTELDGDGDECVPTAVECGPDEVHDAVLGKCVRSGEAYCAEGTELDAAQGLCVAEEISCGDGVIDDDGACVPEQQTSCGAGTVVADGACVPGEVCAEDTEFVDADGACRPTGDVCGEGTAFDVILRSCVPVSTLECGLGTRAGDDGLCVPTRAFYEELAETPDLDMTDAGATGEISPGAAGDEPFVFLGTIDAPEIVDDELVQREDVYHLDADAGQWLQITLYSLGLPEPAFEFSEQSDDGDQFFRLSDLGVGMEVSRQVLVPADGTFELTVSNMPQFLETAPPAGGDDWRYVGYVETLQAPDAEPFELNTGTKAGDIRALTENFYFIDGADDSEYLALIFELFPTHADVELQFWTDETTLDSTMSVDDAVVFEPPADSFYLLIDHVHAFGHALDYAVSAQQGTSLADGETLSEEVELAKGDYVGFFQYNLDGHAMATTIVEGDDPLTSTIGLEVSNAESDPISMYWYATRDATVTLELNNTSGEDLDFLSLNAAVGAAEDLGMLDGTVVQSSYEETLPRGHRHYYEVEIDFDEQLAIRLEDAGGAARLQLFDDDGLIVEQGRNTLVFDALPGSYVLSVEALNILDEGFTLRSSEANLFEVSESNQPIWAIPDDDPDGVTDEIEIDSCPYIQDIEVHTNISHEWRSDLIIDIISPTGEVANIHDRAGLDGNDVIATFPNPVGTGLDSGEELLDFIGTDGTGTWEIFVRDVAPSFTGVLTSWGIDLLCEDST